MIKEVWRQVVGRFDCIEVKLWVRITLMVMCKSLIQHYKIKFVRDLQQVDGFLQILWFPPPIKLTDITEILLKVALNTPTPGERYIESLISTDDITQKY